jgi:hypothetical protein
MRNQILKGTYLAAYSPPAALQQEISWQEGKFRGFAEDGPPARSLRHYSIHSLFPTITSLTPGQMPLSGGTVRVPKAKRKRSGSVDPTARRARLPRKSLIPEENLEDFSPIDRVRICSWPWLATCG